LAANAKGVRLLFYHGPTLPHPAKILQASGNQSRFLRLDGAPTLPKPEDETVLRATVAQGKVGRRRLFRRKGPAAFGLIRASDHCAQHDGDAGRSDV
jgi:hypothetical protein